MSLLRAPWAGYTALVWVLAFGGCGAAQQKGSPSKGSAGASAPKSGIISPPASMTQAWSLRGDWTGVTSNSGTVYASSFARKVSEIDISGKPQRSFTIPGGPAERQSAGSVIRLAHFSSGLALVAVDIWGADVLAFDLSGKLLWRYPEGQGVDDAWPTDLDADGKDEVIVGHNGATGLHVVDEKGQLRWKTTNIGNVWHVCAGDILGKGEIQVVSTSAAGEVHLFDKGGNSIKALGAGCYASMVRVINSPEGDKGATLLLAGSTLTAEIEQRREVLVALSGDGNRRWMLELPKGKTPHVDSACVAPGRPWVAVGMRGGLVHVVDVKTGTIIASTSGQGDRPEVGWVTGKATDAPLLLVATGSSLNAFRISADGK